MHFSADATLTHRDRTSYHQQQLRKQNSKSQKKIHKMEVTPFSVNRPKPKFHFHTILNIFVFFLKVTFSSKIVGLQLKAHVTF